MKKHIGLIVVCSLIFFMFFGKIPLEEGMFDVSDNFRLGYENGLWTLFPTVNTIMKSNFLA